MPKLLRHIRKELLGVVAVTTAIIFFSIKRQTYAIQTETIDQLDDLYTTISQKIDESEMAGDSLFQEQISQRRTTAKQIEQQLPPGSLDRALLHLQSNLALLQDDLPGAREVLPLEDSAGSYFDHATLALLEGYDHRQQQRVEQALANIEQAVQRYAKAHNYPSNQIVKSALEENEYLAGQLYFLVATDLLIEIFIQTEKKFTETLQTDTDLSHLLRSTFIALENRSISSPISLQACRRDLLDEMLVHEKKFLIMRNALASYQLDTQGVLQNCLADPTSCVSDLPVWGRELQEALQRVQLFLESRMAAYHRLTDITVRRDSGALRKLCEESYQKETTSDEFEQILQGLDDAVGSAHQPKTAEESGENAQQELDAEQRQQGLPVQRYEQTTQQIRLREQNWLQKTSDLQRDPTYTPQKFLDALFGEFLGEKNGF